MDEGNAAWRASPRDDKTAREAWLEVIRRLISAINQAHSAAAKSGDPADAPSPALRVQYAVAIARLAWTYLAQSRHPEYETYSAALRLIEPLVEADPKRYAPLRSWLLAEFAFAKGMGGHFNDASLLLQEACATLDLYTMRSWPGCARQEAFLLASIGSMRYAGGQSDLALVETRRAIALAEQIAGGAPDDAMARFLAGCHYRAGECLANMDRRQEAIEEYEQAIALWKPLGEAFVLTCTQVLSRIARCYSELDMPDRAVELLDSVIETLLPFADREPGRYQNMIARLLRNRAMEYRKLGDIAAAEADEAAAAARLDLELQ